MADHDYQPAAGMLSFAPGVTKKTITVLVNADPTSEPPETFQVRLSNPVGATLSRYRRHGDDHQHQPEAKGQETERRHPETISPSRSADPEANRRGSGGRGDRGVVGGLRQTRRN